MSRFLWLLALSALTFAAGCECVNSAVLKREPGEDRYSAKYD
jgi:hypothetical protein